MSSGSLTISSSTRSAWDTHFDEPINVIFLNIFTANRILAGGVNESEPRNVLTCFANSDCRQCFALRKLKRHQNTSGMVTVCVRYLWKSRDSSRDPY